MPPKVPVASTSKLATSAARQHRPNKRVAASSHKAALSSLIDLYHITPTFAPLQTSKLDNYIVSNFAPPMQHIHSPVPLRIDRLVLRDKLLTDRIVHYERQRGLGGVQLDIESAGETSGERDALEDGPLRVYLHGQEPPLRQRVRRLIDAAHGTSSGGLAGLATVERTGQDANRWKQQLDEARQASKRAKARLNFEKKRDEMDPDAFADSWEDSNATPAHQR
ncbi:BZ3500_MvSof-1268-A1-R1_Chr6-3g08828 [Microbotryum saponariae]|uniref:BZ3500_MvSof-1268-A1-R1_Chr6-3g08828 protein n=1 Tax=Microbotryum saponariae TaxID=289078 RepID=A0A2X0KLK2_9BASI|nr:BZ3500_MvSof-1268-A1-R1_Chr6-3g08828 [Microbotryum saponariae]SDA07429.1 BZ3501_MvSof-1269-A2-R1_Chr6-2g08531 [Microbotryum saponariae]